MPVVVTSVKATFTSAEVTTAMPPSLETIVKRPIAGLVRSLLLLLEVTLLWPTLLISTVEGVLMALIAWVTVHLLERRQHMVFRVLRVE